MFEIPFNPFPKFTLRGRRELGIVESTRVVGPEPAVSQPDQCGDKVRNTVNAGQGRTAEGAVMRDCGGNQHVDNSEKAKAERNSKDKASRRNAQRMTEQYEAKHECNLQYVLGGGIS